MFSDFKQRAKVRAILACLLFAFSGHINAQNNELNKILSDYYQERLELFPILATYTGNPMYNDLLQNDGSSEYINRHHKFYLKYIQEE